MKQNVMRSLLIAAVVGSTALPAMAQDKHPPLPGQIDILRPGPIGHQGVAPHGVAHFGLDLAARLSSQETYIGITPEQAAKWRAYTDALLAFSENTRPGPDRPGARRSEGSLPPDGERSDKLFAEHLAERAVAQAEKAQTLQSAAKALREALSPEQLARLVQTETPPQRPNPERSVPHKILKAN